MYLSRIRLDLRHPGVRRALRDCNEMHRDLMSAFPQTQTPEAARRAENMLFRVIQSRSEVTVLMSSDSVPDAENLGRRGYQLSPGSVKDVSALQQVFREGMMLRFELLASPCMKRCSGQKNSRREFLKTETDRAKWLERQGEKGGFQIHNMEESAQRVLLDGTKNGMRIHYDAVRMTGVLEITDAQAFWQAYRQGIGPGKAYGLGMLTVARIG